VIAGEKLESVLLMLTTSIVQTQPNSEAACAGQQFVYF